MNAGALRALRRVLEDRADRAHAAVAAALRAATVAEDERRREEGRVAAVEEQIAAEELPGGVLGLRALAAVAAHRTRLHGIRADARQGLASAADRADAAGELLSRAREAQRDAIRSRTAVEAHHAACRRAQLLARAAAEEVAAEESVAARWDGRR